MQVPIAFESEIGIYTREIQPMYEINQQSTSKWVKLTHSKTREIQKRAFLYVCTLHVLRAEKVL